MKEKLKHFTLRPRYITQADNLHIGHAYTTVAA